MSLLQPAAAVILFCATALPMAAQTSVLVAKSRMLSSVTFDDVRNFALPTTCDEQGRSYVKLVKAGSGMVGPLFRLSDKGVRKPSLILRALWSTYTQWGRT